MAHLVQQMAYVGTEPWHGLGNRLPAKQPLDVWQREADNVEQLKVFAESTDVPVIMVAQMSKAGKNTDAGRMDRNDMGGSGDKSNKANLVVLVRRDRDANGSYSNTVHVQIDKNTMGATGAFDQWMQPEYFRLSDISQ